MIICLDTETTGLSPVHDEILTLSIVDAETGDAVLDGMYRPLRHDSWPEAEAVNHISPDMVMDCPPITDDDERIRDVIEAAEVVVAYNVSFDLPFLEQAVGPLPEDMVVSDPMLDFAAHHGEYDEYYDDHKWVKLVEAARWVGHKWTGEAHGSLADARAAAAVWRWLRDREEMTTCEWSHFGIV